MKEFLNVYSIKGPAIASEIFVIGKEAARTVAMALVADRDLKVERGVVFDASGRVAVTFERCFDVMRETIDRSCRHCKAKVVREIMTCLTCDESLCDPCAALGAMCKCVEVKKHCGGIGCASEPLCYCGCPGCKISTTRKP